MSGSRKSWKRGVLGLAIFSFMPLLVACPKKAVPQVDAAPPPPPEPETGPVNIAPLEEDAGEDAADANDGAKKWTGTAVNPNVARLKQCCGALRAEAKRMGPSPESGLFVGAAAQCDVLAAQAGNSGTAPELGALRGMLAGRTIPAVCAGF